MPNITYQTLRYPAQFRQARVLLLPICPSADPTASTDFSLIFPDPVSSHNGFSDQGTSPFPLVKVDLHRFKHGRTHGQLSLTDKEGEFVSFLEEHGVIEHCQTAFQKREPSLLVIHTECYNGPTESGMSWKEVIVFFDHLDLVDDDGEESQRILVGVISPNGEMECYGESCLTANEHFVPAGASVESISLTSDTRGGGHLYLFVTLRF